MGMIKRIMDRFNTQTERPEENEPHLCRPIVIEFEDYKSYTLDRKYNDLHSYMKKHPQLENHIFDYFYVQIKPMIDYKIFEQENE